MKARWLVVVAISLVLVLLISTAPRTAAYLPRSQQSQSSRPGDLTVPAGGIDSSLVLDSAPESPSAAPCTSQTFPGSATVLYESFDSVAAPGLPTGWGTSTVNGTQGVWRTSGGTVNPAGAYADSLPNLVYFNSRTAPAGETARLYHLTALDLHRFSFVWLCVNWYRDSGYPYSNDRVQVQLYTSGGVAWTDVGPPLTRYFSTDSGWWSRYMSIASVAARQPAVYLGFLGISEQGNDVHLDDIQIVAAQGLYLPLMFR